MHVRYGYRRITVLLRWEGWVTNHKLVYRLYNEQGLGARTRRPRKIALGSGCAGGSKRTLEHGLRHVIRGRIRDREIILAFANVSSPRTPISPPPTGSLKRLTQKANSFQSAPGYFDKHCQIWCRSVYFVTFFCFL